MPNHTRRHIRWDLTQSQVNSAVFRTVRISNQPLPCLISTASLLRQRHSANLLHRCALRAEPIEFTMVPSLFVAFASRRSSLLSSRAHSADPGTAEGFARSEGSSSSSCTIPHSTSLATVPRTTWNIYRDSTVKSFRTQQHWIFSPKTSSGMNLIVGRMLCMLCRNLNGCSLYMRWQKVGGGMVTTGVTALQDTAFVSTGHRFRLCVMWRVSGASCRTASFSAAGGNCGSRKEVPLKSSIAHNGIQT